MMACLCLMACFLQEGLYVYVQLTYKFQLFCARSRGMKKIATDKTRAGRNRVMLPE